MHMADERQTTLMGVRNFLRGGYATAEGPVTVINRAEVVGTWYPAGWEARTPDPDVSISPAGEGYAVIHPTPDDLAGRRRARSKAQAEVLNRMNGGGK